MRNRVCFVGGHSGGHIIPALELAKKAQQKDPKVLVTFFSTNLNLDRSIVKESSYINNKIELNLSGFAKRNVCQYPLGLFQLVYAFLKSFFSFIKNRPEKIVSMGGLVSLPVCLAGWVLRIPIVVYELNAAPGRAIKFLTCFSDQVCYCFDVVRPLFPAKKLLQVSYPVRFAEHEKISKKEARKILNISENAQVIFVLGGSQGSMFLNDFIKNYSKSFLKENLLILHQVGDRDLEDLKNFYKTNGIRAIVFSYIHDLANYYSAADLVIARAGAGTLFELVFFNKKSLIIPLEVSSTTHQVDNAYAIVAKYPQLFTVLKQRQINENLQDAYQAVEKLIS